MDNEVDVVITEKPTLRSPYMVCGKFDIDEKRVAKRIGGFKTALSRRARKDS